MLFLFCVQLNRDTNHTPARLPPCTILPTRLHDTDCVPLHTEQAIYQDIMELIGLLPASLGAWPLFSVVKPPIDNKICLVKDPSASSINCTAEVSGRRTQEGGAGAIGGVRSGK